MPIFIGRNIEQKSKDWLEESAVSHVAIPLIKIQWMAPDTSFFNKIGQEPVSWVISSRQAAVWVKKYHKYLRIKESDTFYCLSSKIREVLGDTGASVAVSPNANRRSLEKLVATSHNRRLIFLKGNRTPSFPDKRTYEVEVYKNILIKPKSLKSFEVYLFFSPSGIESFVQGGNSISAHARIVVIGNTTAGAARKFFKNRIYISQEQNELSVIQLGSSLDRTISESRLTMKL